MADENKKADPNAEAPASAADPGAEEANAQLATLGAVSPI